MGAQEQDWRSKGSVLSPSRTGAWPSILAAKMTTANMMRHRSSRRNPRCNFGTPTASAARPIRPMDTEWQRNHTCWRQQTRVEMQLTGVETRGSTHGKHAWRPRHPTHMCTANACGDHAHTRPAGQARAGDVLVAPFVSALSSHSLPLVRLTCRGTGMTRAPIRSGAMSRGNAARWMRRAALYSAVVLPNGDAGKSPFPAAPLPCLSLP